MVKSVSYLALSCVGFIATAPAMAATAADVPAADVPAADAADADDAQERTDVVVRGAREREGAKDVAPPLNTPRSLVSLPEEVIQQTGSASLADALRTVPGITFGAAEGGNPVGDRPFIRGFDSQGSTFVDGVRDFSAQSREVFAIDSVQVVRGSDSTLGGRGSAGGSINILSKLPVVGDFARASASYGSDDYKRVSVDVNRRVSDLIGVRIAGVWHDQDFAGRDAIWAKRWGVAPSLTIGIDTPTRLTFGYYHLTSHELPDSGIPYLYTATNAPLGTNYVQPAIGRVPLANGTTGYVERSTFYGLKDRDFRDTKTDQATIRFEHSFDTVTLRNTSRWSRNSQDYIYTQPDDQQGNVFGTTAVNTGANLTSGGYVWRRPNTRYGYAESLVNQTDVFGTFHTGGIEHSFAAGGEVSFEKARRGVFVTRGFLNATGSELLSNGSTITPRCNTTTVARFYCTSLFNPNPNDLYVNYANDTSNVAAPMVKNLPIAETQNDARTKSVYLFDSITLSPQLIVNLGLRYDNFTSKVTPGQPITATETFSLSRTDNLFNYQAGLIFKPTANTSLYASYATAATPPNSLLGEGQESNALGTTNTPAAIALLDSLKVEKSRSYEVGAKANVLNEQLALAVAAFQTDTDNARVTGSNNTVEFVGKRRIRGVEFTASGKIFEGLTVFGGYTYLDPKIVDGGFSALTAAAVGTQAAKTVLVPSVNTGRQATQTAKHSASISTDWQVNRRFSIGGGAYYTSRVFGGYADNRTATQTAAGLVTVNPATRVSLRSIPGYVRLDAHAGIKLSDAIDLAVNVQNLTNKTYFTQAFTAHYATIAAGRSAFATLNLKF